MITLVLQALCGSYLLLIALCINTANTAYTVGFKFVPTLLAIAVLINAYATFMGWPI